MKKGFTLVELLAATVLSALLAMAVLAVIASLARSDRKMAANDQHASWPMALKSVLRFDLLNGREVVMTGNGVSIQGYCTLDPATGEPTHKPSLVRYAVQRVGDRSWLTRIQKEPGKQASIDLLCADVSAIKFFVPHGSESFAGRPSIQPTTNPTEINSIPPELELVVNSVDPNITPFDEVITLR